MKNHCNINDSDIEIKDKTNKENNFNYDINYERIGLILKILYYLYQNSTKDGNDSKLIFKMSYMEILKKQIIDLLNPSNTEK